MSLTAGQLPSHCEEDRPLELYNLKTDPQEKNNLAATNKKVVNELSAALRRHIQRGGETPWQAPPAK